MDKNMFEITAIKYLSKELDPREVEDFENELDNNPEYRERFRAMENIWVKLASNPVPEPREEMHNRFYGMLQNEIAKNGREEKSFFQNIQEWATYLFMEKWKLQMAYSLILLSAAFLSGYYLRSYNQINLVTEEQHIEIENLREQLVMVLLEEPSTTKRLQAVNESAKMNRATQPIIEALFATLNNDPNINVRLAAIESLESFADNPEVRTGLVESIAKQESPLVQIALADLMVALQEKNAVQHIEQLLKKQTIDAAVKQRLQESIAEII